MSYKYEAKGIKLFFKSVIGDSPEIELYNDFQHLLQSVFNLLVNSLKYTDEGKVVVKFKPIFRKYEIH